MEKQFKIPIPKTKLHIYAKQYGALNRPVVIFVHGLSGHMDEHLFYNGARFFDQHGISSIRFNLYDYEPDARKLTDCTLAIHAQDFNLVVRYLREHGVKKLFAIGHSYGGPTILLADHNQLDGVVLWDPSYGDIFSEENPLYVKELDAYRLRWGFDLLIGSTMYDERSTILWATLTAKTIVPLKIISAGKGILTKTGENYIKPAQGPTELVTIQDADHNFFTEGTADKLFTESLDWIKKYES